MVKLCFVLGTRPEAIKLAPLILLAKEVGTFDVKVCVTGQHKEMLQQVIDVFNIKVDVDLKLMTKNQSLPDFLARSLMEINTFLEEWKPDFVIVQGDTSTVLSASLAGFYNKCKLLHIEAGLRTNDIFSPFPEEMNRRLTSHLAFFHFAPTEISKNNLLKEGVSTEKILVTGNTAIDSLLYIKSKIFSGEIIPAVSDVIKNVIESGKKIVLITGHRRENFGLGFDNICTAISQSAYQHPNSIFIYPVHLNPNVKNVVERKLSGISNVLLIEPLAYVEFVYLMMNAYIILTDSGGVQEEAPSLKKPILVMRESTERPEGVIAGCSKLVGTNINSITKEINNLINNEVYYNEFIKNQNPYGDGEASKKVIEMIQTLF